MLTTSLCSLILLMTCRKNLTGLTVRFARQVGLKISPNQTEVLSVNILAPLPIKIGQLHLTTTQQFTYLGSAVFSEGEADLDIRQRIGRARGAFTKLRPVWTSRKYSRSTKIKGAQSRHFELFWPRTKLPLN